MPTNRELMIAQRKKEKVGLPPAVTEFFGARKNLSSKINRKTPKRTGIQTRGLPPEPEKIVEPVLAKEAISSTLASAATASADPIAAPEKPVVSALDTLKPGEGFLTSQKDPGFPRQQKAGGGFAEHAQQTGKTGGQAKSFSFGLPTDRLPSFSELGGAIGQMFKFVGGITKKRQALGLIPGTVNFPKPDKGLSLTTKDRATILTKRLEDLTLTDDERIGIKAELDKILNPQNASRATDIETIRALP